MLERLVAWVLNNYLGKYVENLNTDQLSIALMRGSVELENLPLKKDALRHFGLPIKLKSGFIGKIKLKIPVTQIKSAPWLIVIEDVTVIVSPIHLSEWDKDLEEQAAHEYKLSLLDSMEAMWRTTNMNTKQESSYYASSYYSWFSYGSGLVTNIVENLQLQIKDVHFRYEDSLSIDNESFALGVVIESLMVQSCDEKWQPTYTSSDAGTKYSYQLSQLTGFSIYWDTIPVSKFWGDLDLAQLAVTSKQHNDGVGHNYILLPVSAKAHVKRNRSAAPLRSKTHPRIVCDLQLESVPFSLSDVQYSEVIGCVKGLSTVQQCQKFIHLRPSVSVKENPKAWWLYAINCDNLSNRGSLAEPATWETSLIRARENVAYVQLYTTILSSPVGAATNIPSDLKELKNKIEWERGYEELRALREVAMFRARVPPPPPENEKLKKGGGSALQRWFPQWRGWYSSSNKESDSMATVTEDVKSEVDKNIGQLEEEILDVLADTVENNSILKRDTVFAQLNFELKEGTFSLISIKKSVVELQFSKVRLELETRLRTSSSRINVSLGGITLYDRLTENSIFPILISPQSSENAPSSKMNRNIPPTIAAKLLNQSQNEKLASSNNVPDCFFELMYEVNPFNSRFDYKFHIWSQSLDVVYNPETTKWLVDFFTKPHQSIDYELRNAAKQRYNAMKQKTKDEILKNWDSMLQGHSGSRKYWDIKLDISAPQIFLVERFIDKNTVVCIVDFGKLFFSNQSTLSQQQGCNGASIDESISVASGSRKFDAGESMDSEDSDDDFATPCYTPPESTDSEPCSSRKLSAEDKNTTDANELTLHNKLYDSYQMEFNELQILLGRMKDNWKFAHLKGNSSLHVLDRFNITLQIERRIVNTTDPNFPAVTVFGNLPKLVVHANEQKIQALCTIFDTISSSQNVQTPHKPKEYLDLEEIESVGNAIDNEKSNELSNAPEYFDNPESKLLMIQFIIDHLELELQSRGRSIAELQVSGVKAVVTKRPLDISLSLSVHSLLLVDALQTFGPDFELLVASHKHVGMDSISGSLRDSDPTSPTSPASPDHGFAKSKNGTPFNLNQVISSLQNDASVGSSSNSNIGTPAVKGGVVSSDSEALIMVDIVFVQGKNNPLVDVKEDMQIVSIQFNNLDIVANQETIVELISFSKRILTQIQSNKVKPSMSVSEGVSGLDNAIASETAKADSTKSTLQLPLTLPSVQPLRSPVNIPPEITKTKLTFDFHRLNILLLRSVVLDNGAAIAKKIATATMMNAKVHATVGNALFVEGSLGGIQILDLTSEGHIHQRILSVGQDPLKFERRNKEKRYGGDLFEYLSADIYNIGQKPQKEKGPSIIESVQAFNFTVMRQLNSKIAESNEVSIKVRFSSALYTHAPHFVAELSCYATEFKHYLKNLAKSIGSAATEMAIGLVHARAEAIAQSLSINNRFSFYGSTSELQTTPRKQNLRSPSIDHGTENEEFNTSFTAVENDTESLNIKLDVLIDTPVIILPRYATSYEVFVAHLGRITIFKGTDTDEVTGEQGKLWSVEKYTIEIRDMNLYSLDTRQRFQLFTFRGDHIGSIGEYPSIRAEDIYTCRVDAKPVLHDTLIQLCVEHDTKLNTSAEYAGEFDCKSEEQSENFQVSGKIVTPLKVSLSREQYEQLLQTVDTVVADSSVDDAKSSVGDFANSSGNLSRLLPGIEEEGEYRMGVSALDLDPALRARMLSSHSSSSKLQNEDEKKTLVVMKVCFEIPVFTVELKADFGNGEQSLVDVSFCDFILQFEKSNSFETRIEVSLQSLIMEDLQREPNSKHRYMVTSSVCSSSAPPDADYVSISCPNLSIPSSTVVTSTVPILHSSLPDYLETETVFGGFSKKSKIHSSSTVKTVASDKYKNAVGYPCTPPPSPRERRQSTDIYNEDNLVHIKVVTYTKESEAFQQNKLCRTVTMNFNTLNMIVNLESWVVVLDFFGLGASPDENEVTQLNTVPQSQSKPVSRRPSLASIHPTTVEESDSECTMRTELDVTVKSLSLILNRTECEVARANISKLSANIVKNTYSPIIGDVTSIDGEVGSLSVHDLTPVHSKLYSERFLTSDLSMSMKRYSKPDKLYAREYDMFLKLSFPVMIYTHTQRFISEIQAYFKHFSHVQSILSSIRSSAKMDDETSSQMRMKIDVSAQSPVIILPLSSQHSQVLIVDLGTLLVNNSFKWFSPENKFTSSDETQLCLLDVMEIKLSNMDLYTGKRESTLEEPTQPSSSNKKDHLSMGSYCIMKNRPSLLQENCELELEVQRNLTSNISKIVPDMSFKGVLSTLAIALSIEHYKLLRGLLAFNLGEPLDDLFTEDSPSFNQEEDVKHSEDVVWTANRMQIDLVNVSVKLLNSDDPFSNEALACINFIKSQFTVESFSDKSQDIDLISQEILVTDTRFLDQPANKRTNIFTNILQPLTMPPGNDNVRVEVHLRKHVDQSKITVLLNNMRLMAILDWWEMLRDFVTADADFAPSEINCKTMESNVQSKCQSQTPQQVVPFEMKLNVTDSEIVLLEDTSQWDTNAVIFKSTTVINFKPHQLDKPVSCSLNHCEMYSCVLGMEDETALSIIDPVTINCEISQKTEENLTEPVKVLQILSQQLYFRLSYNDVQMFMRILDSVPKQTSWGRNKKDDNEPEMPINVKNQINKLSTMGFASEDCAKALQCCNGNLDDTALWLTKNASANNGIPISTLDHSSFAQNSPSVTSTRDSPVAEESPVDFQFLELKTDCLSICIIDDCRDSDVPLLELSMTNLSCKLDMKKSSGLAECSFSIDYYNRFLSGWEPFIEPWCCQFKWNKTLATDLFPNRLIASIKAQEVLNVNITRTLLDIYENVKESWTQDYYNLEEKCEIEGRSKSAISPSYRRRSPFIPFALKNNTGCQIWYITSVISEASYFTSEVDTAQEISEDVRWHSVNTGDTVSFSFEEQGKLRHGNTHKVQSHQIVVRVEGWKPVKPVSVDRVGVYFRQAVPDHYSNQRDLPHARIVFDVSLEGSARKLITVRSALLLNNRLELPVEIKLENPTSTYSNNSPLYRLLIGPGQCEPVPLSHTHAQISLMPVNEGKSQQNYYAFCYPAIFWQHVQKPGEVVEEIRECPGNTGSSYRFCVVVQRENYPIEDPISAVSGMSSSSYNVWTHPGHFITFISPMVIINLLPYELHYNVNEIEMGRIRSGQQVALHEVSPDIVTEINFRLDNYPGEGKIVIPATPSSFDTKLKVQDPSGRRLNLRATINVQRGSEIKVTVYSPFWIINKTALPLVFRQEGVAVEMAGQYEEHEIARMVAPLMFSLTDPDASPICVARVGTGMHKDGTSQWCQHFHLHTGIQVRRLRVSLRDNRPDIIYMIGINVRAGRGRYRNTYIVTLTSHYQIHNKSSYTLQIAQKTLTTTVNDSSIQDVNCLRYLFSCCRPYQQLRQDESDPGAQATYLQALPNCCLPFHWPRQDKDQLVSIKIVDIPGCCWSGGFRIKNDAFHINVRDESDQMYFVRIEIFLQDATFFIIFTDADTMPPPIRIDNFSQVPIEFHQSSCMRLGTVRPHCSVAYAWDEPAQPFTLNLAAPGGVSANYDVNRLGKANQLTYENFIYIAFAATFNNVADNDTSFDPLDVHHQQLVLDVIGNSGRVILNRKEDGARSQLWRMTAEGLLQHEGSSPPTDPMAKHSSNSKNILVLDISSPGIKPTEYVNLTLQKVNKRRKSTQTWHFTEEGRLCCAHNNLCVQSRDGFFGLRKGNDAVLGPIQTTGNQQLTATGIPLEQAIVRQRLRPGSGCLDVNIITDGPTRVVDITDVKDKRTTTLIKDGDWICIDKVQRQSLNTKEPAKENIGQELEMKVDLPCGIGLSLISAQPAEELLFTRLAGIHITFVRTRVKESLEVSVKDIQIDNQLFDTQCPVMLYVTPLSKHKDIDEISRSAVYISFERMLNNTNIISNAEIFKALLVRVKNLNVALEDRLLLKLFMFAGFTSLGQDQENIEENDFEMQRMLSEVAAINAKRYYFEIMELIFGQVRLSVATSNKLPPELQSVKKQLNLTLIKFEDAAIDLKPFTKFHIFETSSFLSHLIMKHFQSELKWQAAMILGSVDFLGNPLGFVNDISEGVTGLIYEGNIGGLVQNVAHGLSNSAAKVTGTLSDGLGVISMDDQHQEGRNRIRSQNPTSGHMVAGLKGFGHGIMGGITSVFKQTYEGASNEGVQGFITGFGKGLVGTVTKPVVGVLDLASETASAVRDSSRSKTAPTRIRYPRCVVGPTGLLPPHSVKQSLGQEYLYNINHRDYSEVFIAYEILRSGVDDLQVIVSSKKIRIFSHSSGSVKGCSVVIETNLSDLLACQAIVQAGGHEQLHYIELTVRDASLSNGKDRIKSPRVRCDNEHVAAWVSEQINNAKNMYIEKQHTLISIVNNIGED